MMPLSPVSRCYRRGELILEKNDKKGYNFERRSSLKAEDDDLSLFNEMQKRESVNLLFHTPDDFEDSMSNLRYLSDFKLDITGTVQGESTDLLNADGEKNDYDWLLTPPETPLFASLDVDEHQPINLLPRGRPQNRSISSARLSNSERTLRTSRDRASPCRRSPSPHSNKSFTESRGRVSSVSSSSPPLAVRPLTPSRRLVIPNKPSNCRMSTGSSRQVSFNGKHGASPIKAIRGNSASPRLRGLHTPPKLQTSLFDRPTLHTSVLSPSSRKGRSLSSEIGVQPISTATSSSVSLLHNHERVCLSSSKRGSLASSSDDDSFLHSISMDLSLSIATRKNALVVNNKSITFSKKPIRSLSASSVPKSSFNSAHQLMDHHKIPPDMFRPLLSSVPTSTYSAGKANSMHAPMFSMNSSLTTSSNESSELGATITPDIEGGDRDHNVLACEWGRLQDLDVEEEIFLFDKVDLMNQDSHGLISGKPQYDGQNFNVGMGNEVEPQGCNSSMNKLIDAKVIITASESSYASNKQPQGDSCELMATCARCGKIFPVIEVDDNTNACQDCSEKCELCSTGEPSLFLSIDEDERVETGGMTINMDILGNTLQTSIDVPECSSILLVQHERNDIHVQDSLPDSWQMFNQKDQHCSGQHLDSQEEVSSNKSDDKNLSRQSTHMIPPCPKVEYPEGSGISLLLMETSNSYNLPFVQGRTLTTSNILFTEPSYARGNINAMNRSIDWDSTSTSSVDPGSLKHKEEQIYCQSNLKEIDILISDNEAKSQFINSQTEDLTNMYETSIHSKSESEEDFNHHNEELRNKAFGENMLNSGTQKASLVSTGFSVSEWSTIQQSADKVVSVYVDNCVPMNPSDSHYFCQPESTILHDVLEGDDKEDNTSCVSAEVQNVMLEFSIFEEDSLLDVASYSNDSSDAAAKNSSALILEHEKVQHIQTKLMLSENPSFMEAFHEHSFSTILDRATGVSLFESNSVNLFQEKQTVTMDGPGGHILRSFTLEEAADIILFCSSIVHNIAYTATNVAMEKDSALLEADCPTITIVGDHFYNQKNSRETSVRNTTKLDRIKQKKSETHTKAADLGNHAKATEVIPSFAMIPSEAGNIKTPKLEPKCNCIIM